MAVVAMSLNCFAIQLIWMNALAASLVDIWIAKV